MIELCYLIKIIWAHGRNDIDFYAEDELKYHGKSNRGIGQIEIGN